MSEMFMLVKLGNKRKEFKCSYSCQLFNVDIGGRIKIDTGAVRSLFPLRSMNFANSLELEAEDKLSFYNDFKTGLLDKGVPYSYLKGVEHTGENNEKLSPYDRKDVTFQADIHNLSVCDYYISDIQSVRITCDTTGNVLLGMDILSKFDFHCGISSVIGEYIFLGCLRDRINPAYLSALKEHFGMIPAQ